MAATVLADHEHVMTSNTREVRHFFCMTRSPLMNAWLNRMVEAGKPGRRAQRENSHDDEAKIAKQEPSAERV